ncbi:retrovirus-related pol polyprotein from transposon TNT 1-94, partial [Tanacetum coccineum]
MGSSGDCQGGMAILEVGLSGEEMGLFWGEVEVRVTGDDVFFKGYFNAFDKTLFDEITKVQNVFNQIEAAVDQCSVDKNVFEIQIKQLSIDNDQLLKQIMSQEILFELNDLKAQSQEKDTVIRKLKDRIKSLSGKDSLENVKKDIDEIETINIELEHSVAKLLSENENLRKEREHLKSIYKDQFDSIRKTRVQSKEHCDSLIAQINAKSVENSDLNAQLQEKVFAITALKNELRKLKGKNVVDTAVSKPNATIAPGMFKLDIEPISHRLKNNRDAHEVYIEKTIENTDTLRGFVERARTQNPSEPLLESACMFTKHVQELLVYVSQTCPNSPKPSEKLVAVTPMNKDKRVRFAEPVTSSSNIPKQTDSLKTKDSNKPLLTSTGVKPTTSASGSKPSGNTKNNRITRPPSSNQKNKVEDHSRKVKSSLNKKISNALVKHSVRNAKFESMCAICNKCLFDANHDMCLIDFVNVRVGNLTGFGFIISKIDVQHGGGNCLGLIWWDEKTCRNHSKGVVIYKLRVLNANHLLSLKELLLYIRPKAEKILSSSRSNKCSRACERASDKEDYSPFDISDPYHLLHLQYQDDNFMLISASLHSRKIIPSAEPSYYHCYFHNRLLSHTPAVHTLIYSSMINQPRLQREQTKERLGKMQKEIQLSLLMFLLMNMLLYKGENKGIWMAVLARFQKDSKSVESSTGNGQDNDDYQPEVSESLPSSLGQVALALKTRGGLESMSFDDLYNKLRSLELDVKIGHSYGVKATAAPTHSAFIGTACSGSKPTYSDQQRIYCHRTEVKTDEPKALVSVDSMVNWSDHAAENKTGEVAKVYGMMAGLHADSADASDGCCLRTKVGLGFQEYFGVDEVFDLSTPSVFYSDPVEKESDIEETQTLRPFASVILVSRPNQKDIPPAVDIQTLPELICDFYNCVDSVPCNSKAARSVLLVLGFRQIRSMLVDSDLTALVETDQQSFCGSWISQIVSAGRSDVIGNYRIPRKHDLYTFHISHLQPEQKVTCLVAKASLDESTRWHRRMAHVNFKTINKLAKEGLVDGLPLKVLHPAMVLRIMERNADYAEELAKLQRQEYEAKDAAARYGYLFSQATAEILCQAEADIRTQGVSAVQDPAGIDSAVKDSAGVDSAVRFGSKTVAICSADRDPAGVSSVSADFNPVYADESTLPPGHPIGPSEKHTTDFPVPYDILGDLASPVLTRSKNQTSIAKALEDPDWVDAMQEEMQQFINQQVWKLVPLPAGKHAIGTKWILKNKRDARGIVVRNKARLVAQGHRQEEGIDY